MKRLPKAGGENFAQLGPPFILNVVKMNSRLHSADLPRFNKSNIFSSVGLLGPGDVQFQSVQLSFSWLFDELIFRLTKSFLLES